MEKVLLFCCIALFVGSNFQIARCHNDNQCAENENEGNESKHMVMIPLTFAGVFVPKRYTVDQ